MRYHRIPLLLVGHLVLALGLLSLPAHADSAVLHKRSLGIEGARRAIAAAAAEAHARKAGAVIAVVDDGGNLMALERLDDTFPAGALISYGKARTAALFKKPTRFFEELVNKGRTAMVALDGFTPLQGGVPIVIDGQVVGAVGVSGASSAAQDEEFALVAAAALGSAPPPAPHAAAPINFIPGDKVASAFAKGAPLLEVDNYKVHASHRDGAGQAEVHAADTDIIYVVDGSATLVTGGAVPDAHAVAPEEQRGASIVGGDRRHLGKGDVVVIPKGVPHQFSEVPVALSYYVVKVR